MTSVWFRLTSMFRKKKEIVSPMTPKPQSKPTIASSFVFVKPTRHVNRVFVHCSASDNEDHDDISVIKQWHLARKWKTVGYHYFITKKGHLQIGRSLEIDPAAQYPHNEATIAICLHGLKKENFTEKQFVTLRNLCLQINEAYDKMITFHGHREVAAKECPVFDYKQVLGLDHFGHITAA